MFRRCCSLALLAGFVATTVGVRPACGQWGGLVPRNQFELVDAVQLDRIDNAVEAQLERAKSLLADRQWNEAIEILARLSESSEGKLLSVTSRRCVGLREWCQIQLAALPPEALKLYRDRIDPLAKTWYEQGVAQRSRTLLQNVVDQALASSYGDSALLALGDLALESGDATAARWAWERILPNAQPSASARTWPGHPDTDLDRAAVLARLVLASIVEAQKAPAGANAASSVSRAKVELAAMARLYPDAKGRLGGREGKYVDLLRTLLAESESWPPAPIDRNWPTFAGSPLRTRTALPLIDVGATAWRVPLRPGAAEAVSQAAFRLAGEDPREPLSFHPVTSGNVVLVNDSRQILALDLATGKPAWGQSAAIYRSELADVVLSALPPETIGVPRFTLTVFENRLLARMGSPLTGQPQGVTTTGRPGYLVCLDLAAEGRLLWKVEPEEGWAFEGSPIADARGVYVAMRRQDIRPQAFVACFDADTGRLRWRRFVCGAETPARGVFCESTHNLLTLCGGVLYYNTNLGAVAAVSTEDGHPLWVALYPRARRGNIAELAPHWRRDLNPCVFHDGTLLVAPADSPRLFAFDAASGQTLWQSGIELEDVVDLLGVAGDWLIASGRRLYWVSLKEEDRGRTKHVWPDGPSGHGYGRGLLAGDCVLWPTRDKLYLFDQQTAEPRRAVDLAVRGLSGGNLMTSANRLLIATEDELVAIDPRSATPQPPASTRSTP